MRFSKTTQSFYPNDIIYPSLPADIANVTQADFDLAMSRPLGAMLDLVNGRVVIVPVPALTLVQAQAEQTAIINTACQTALAAIVASYPALEVATFPNQYAEAQAYTANNAAPTPTLSAIATASGQDVAAVAVSVLAKAAAYTVASGAAVGRRQALTAQISAATTVAAVQAIAW
ncbi:MAG: hypothetical protein M0Q22_15930 [Sulfuritalea sp.]|jgi:hypothetical protein|nr:hypothetical protein [Sulfuritalea sp.]